MLLLKHPGTEWSQWVAKTEYTSLSLWWLVGTNLLQNHFSSWKEKVKHPECSRSNSQTLCHIDESSRWTATHKEGVGFFFPLRLVLLCWRARRSVGVERLCSVMLVLGNWWLHSWGPKNSMHNLVYTHRSQSIEQLLVLQKTHKEVVFAKMSVSGKVIIAINGLYCTISKFLLRCLRQFLPF